MDNTSQDLMWIYWSIKSYRRRKGEIFREDREEEDGGFELYKSILFKYLMIITTLILSSGEMKATSQSRAWDNIIASQCVLTSRCICNFCDVLKAAEICFQKSQICLQFISVSSSLRFSFQVNQITETTQIPNPQFGWLEWWCWLVLVEELLQNLHFYIS